MMFERFTEHARRALFFARAKTSERDGDEISPEDLLAGLLLAAPDALLRFASRDASEPIRPAEDGEQWFQRVETGELFKTPITREIPFSAATKGAIERAVEEADSLGHRFVRPEHLLLGLLRDEGTEAWRTLQGAGISLREVRSVLEKEPDSGEPPWDWGSGRK